MPRIFLLSGPRGVGKSTVCGRVAEEVGRRGFRVGGVMTERSEVSAVLFAETDSRHLVDLSTGERIPFGRRGGDGMPDPSGGSGTLPHIAVTDAGSSVFPLADHLTPGWEFGGQVFQFGEQAIRAAADSDLLVVDELGPLELRGGRGWAAAVPVLRAGAFGAALVVCRPELLGELQAALGRGDAGPAGAESTDEEPSVFSLTEENRRGMFSRLTRELLATLASSR